MSCFITLLILTVISPGSGPAQSPEVRDISSYFREIIVARDESVGTVQCSGCSVVVLGTATEDVIALGGDVTVEGTVKGDAIALGGSIHLLPGSQLEGDAAAIGGSVRVDAGARAQGDTDSLPFLHVPGQRSFHVSSVSSLLAVNLLLLLLGAMIFRRRRAENLAGAVILHPGTVALAGLLLLCLTLLLFILAGIPAQYELLWISLIGLSVLFLSLAGYLGVCEAIGGLVTRRGLWLVTPLAGAVLVTVLLLIPVAGFAFLLASFVAVLGSALVSGLGKSPGWLLARLKQRSASR
jgi:hypothetical protein